MNPHVARKIFDVLTHAEIAHRLSGVQVADYCRRQALKTQGELRRELLRVSRLGPKADLFMDYFLSEFEDDHHAPT